MAIAVQFECALLRFVRSEPRSMDPDWQSQLDLHTEGRSGVRFVVEVVYTHQDKVLRRPRGEFLDFSRDVGNVGWGMLNVGEETSSRPWYCRKPQIRREE